METDPRFVKPEELRQFASNLSRGGELIFRALDTLEEKQKRLDEALRIIDETRNLRNALLTKVAEALAKERNTNTEVNDECRSVVKDERIEAVLDRIAEAIGIRCDNCEHFHSEFKGAICGRSGLVGCEEWVHNRSKNPLVVRYTPGDMREAANNLLSDWEPCASKEKDDRNCRDCADWSLCSKCREAVAMLRQAAVSEDHRQFLDIEVTRLSDELKKRDLELAELKQRKHSDMLKEVLEQVRFELNSAMKMREYEKDDKTCELLDLRIEAFQRVLRKAGE